MLTTARAVRALSRALAPACVGQLRDSSTRNVHALPLLAVAPGVRTKRLSGFPFSSFSAIAVRFTVR